MKNGKLVILQRSLFPYSIERTVYTIWYKIYAYQNILSSKADNNQWFLYRLAMFFHPDNLSFLLNIYDPYNLNLWNNWAYKLVGLAYQALRIWTVLPLYVTLSHQMMHQDASLWFPFICLSQIWFACFPPWWFLCVVFKSIIPQLSHRTFIFCPVTLQDLFS